MKCIACGSFILLVNNRIYLETDHRLSSKQKMWKTISFICISLVCSTNAKSAFCNQSDELVFVHILFRHGDRNIIETYPNDPWKNEQQYWPEGFGQLTNLGRQQHHKLGSFLRRRYFNLISNKGSYHLNNIYVRSTDVDRTLMSAAHNLAGFFPPQNHQIWNESLQWQAIPIHTIPEKLDHILASKRPCPLYLHSFADYLQSPEIQLILKNNQSLIEYLELHTGQMIRTISDVKVIYQALWVEHLKRFPLPTWTDKVFVPGGDFEKMAFFAFKMETNSKILARLKTGFLIRDILDRFTQKKDSTLFPDRSLWIYSAHDSTLANILNFLGLLEQPHIPGYASCLLFELHKVNETYHIEIFYKRHHDEATLEPQYIPNCGWKCSLTEFYKVFQHIMPTDNFEVECRLPTDSENSANINSIPKNTSGTNILTLTWITIGMAVLFIIY